MRADKPTSRVLVMNQPRQKEGRLQGLPVPDLTVINPLFPHVGEMLQARHVILSDFSVHAYEMAIRIGCPCCKLCGKYIIKVAGTSLEHIPPSQPLLRLLDPTVVQKVWYSRRTRGNS